jgi:hypothetical protein
MKDSEEIITSLLKLCSRIKEISERDFIILNEVQLGKKVKSDDWSISDCLKHNILITENYLSKVEMALSGRDVSLLKNNGTGFRSGFLGNYFVKSVKLKEDNSVVKMYRTSRFLNPISTEDFVNHVVKQFIQSTDRIINILKQLEEVNLESISIPMPGLPFVRLRLGDMLCYIVYHIERHFVQALRTYIEISFQNKNDFELLNQ